LWQGVSAFPLGAVTAAGERELFVAQLWGELK
jgi:hypothetical protein